MNFPKPCVYYPNETKKFPILKSNNLINVYFSNQFSKFLISDFFNFLFLEYGDSGWAVEPTPNMVQHGLKILGQEI